MIREEANRLFDAIFKHEYINGQGHMIAPKHEAWKLIDKIYDSLEALEVNTKDTKSCENCKHSRREYKKYYYCYKQVREFEKGSKNPYVNSHNFCCNKHEPK